MPVFLKDDTKVLFIHVPKTGGTAVEHLFRNAGYEIRLRQTKANSGAMQELRRCSPQHMHASLLREILRLPLLDPVFMLVRDPIARFRSEYAMRQAKSMRTDAASVEAWADQVLSDYARNPYTRDNHLRPQAQFRLPRTRVFRLEDGLEKLVVELNSSHALGLDTDVPRTMVSPIRSSDVEISPRLERRLREVYAEDYEAFGY